MNQDLFESATEQTPPPESRVIATRVEGTDRDRFLPGLFPRHVMIGEMTTYAKLDELCADYRGGLWDFYSLSNTGGYLAPSGDETYRIVQPANYFDGTVSADAAGIIATLYALSALSFAYSDVGSDRFMQLREFAMTHPESSQIFKAID